jgi:lipopolysaccharide transport system ATP-binding protein
LFSIEVKGVSKSYPLHSSSATRLRQAIFGPRESADNSFWALRDVSLEVQKGESFGIIGENGSGKSTLLQIISGILQPNSGTVNVNGRLSALLELGSGFNPEFNGRDNVYLNASILGLTHEEIDERFGAIEAFANIGSFIEQPIKTYSSGMVLRLAFAVAVHVDAEILIIDEALAVGDIAFRQRCMRRIHELRSKGVTILFVSHDAGDVKTLCDRCLWLNKGKVEQYGEADYVISKYLTATVEKHAARARREPQRGGAESSDDRQPSPYRRVPGMQKPVAGLHRYGDNRAVISALALFNHRGQATSELQPAASVTLRVDLEVRADLFAPIVGFLVRNDKGETIFGSNTARENYPLPFMIGGDFHSVDFAWTTPELAPGAYFISVAVSNGTTDEFEVCDYIENALALSVPQGPHPVQGYMHFPCPKVVIHKTPASGSSQSID